MTEKPSRLCRTHETNRNEFDPDGCIACQAFSRGYLYAQKHMNIDIERLRNQAHCTHESAEPMPTSPDDETVYVCPDCEYTWSESE